MQTAIQIPNTILIEMKRKAYDALKHTGFLFDGTIFGGFVRDEFISEYYTAKFNREYEDTTKYWDTKYMPETKARTLISNDMDISFKREADAICFIDAVRRIKEFETVVVADKTNRAEPYSAMRSVLQSIRQMVIYMRVGYIPFKSEGLIVNIYVDIVVPINPILQPPFNNLDMLCNGFIMTKEGGKQFSRNTGTIIDKFSDYERAVIVPQIIKDMHEFKTYICMTSTASMQRSINISALNRVRKLVSKKVNWTILNMPFKKEIYKVPIDTSEKHDCSICLDVIEDGQEVAYTTIYKEEEGLEIPAGKLHCKCMMQHLYCQQQSFNILDNHEERIFTFKCPFRNKITFTRCKLDIQFAYKTAL
jgi:Ribonuclease G/E